MNTATDIINTFVKEMVKSVSPKELKNENFDVEMIDVPNLATKVGKNDKIDFIQANRPLYNHCVKTYEEPLLRMIAQSSGTVVDFQFNLMSFHIFKENDVLIYHKIKEELERAALDEDILLLCRGVF
jgi:hypothetical protein